MAATYTNTRPAMPSGVLTLPSRYYTDPDHFTREIRAIHSTMWLAAGRTDELAAPGQYVLRRLGAADVIVARTQDRRIAAFHNVCRHRGTRLCKDASGTFPGSIQCPYHAWTYGLDGRLLSAPHMDRVEGFDAKDHALAPVATAEWDGHLFINLSPAPEPFERHLAGLDARFRPWRMEELTLVERRVYDVRANWKLIIQNYSECLHCPVAHPLLNRQSHYMSGDNEPPQPTYLGGRMDLREGVATHSLDGQATRACFRDLSPEDRRRVYYYAILPNFLLNLHPDYMLTFQLWPIAPDHTRVVCEWSFHPDEIEKPDFDAGGPVGFWELTNREDWELSEAAQAGIASAGYQPGPYSNREEFLAALDRWVLDRVPPE